MIIGRYFPKVFIPVYILEIFYDLRKILCKSLYSRSRDLVGRNILSNSLYSSLYSSLYYRPRDFYDCKNLYFSLYSRSRDFYDCKKIYFSLYSRSGFGSKILRQSWTENKSATSTKELQEVANGFQVFYVSKFSSSFLCIKIFINFSMYQNLRQVVYELKFSSILLCNEIFIKFSMNWNFHKIFYVS